MYQLNNSVKLVDYDKWYERAWASGLLKGILSKYEVKPVRILRNDEDPNHVIVVLTAQSLGAFDKVRADPRVQELVSDRSIVAVPPQPLGRYTATEISDPDPEANYGFHVEHKLVDYDKWFAIFKDADVRKQIEGELGIRARRVLRDVDNPNNAVVIFQGPSQEAMDKLHTDPRVQERFNDKSIFVDPPKVLGRFTSVSV
ncbi:hypothetical protein OAJ77_03130 [Rhodospirillales bacterium]|nr:hypothetical protein [Rhodospirillales bacterium]